MRNDVREREKRERSKIEKQITTERKSDLGGIVIAWPLSTTSL